MTFFASYESPLGTLTLVAGPDGLRGVAFPDGRPPAGAPPRAVRAPDRLAAAVAQLDEYFAGERTAFELPLELVGTPFQQQVWAALRRIGYGATTTYGALARDIDAGRALTDLERVAHVRAVGSAIGRTPTPIVVPCHRVVGADGSLTGYGGGLRRKEALLALEATGGSRVALDAAWGREQLALL